MLRKLKIVLFFGFGWVILALLSFNSLTKNTANNTKTIINYTNIENSTSDIVNSIHISDNRYHEIIDSNYYSKKRIKIFVDLGANIGDTLELFYHTRYSHTLDDGKEFIAFAFEPDGMNEKHLNNFVKTHPLMTTYIIMKGASIKNETVLFWSDTKNNGLGSKIIDINTANVQKICGYTKKFCHEIVTIDIVKWISNICPSQNDDDCYISLKIDIEGNEYQVLEKLAFNKKLCIIDELHIEWHSIKKFKFMKKRKYIIDELNKCGINLKYITFPIDTISLDILHESFSWNDMQFFEKFEDCKWNNTATGKLIRVSWCDEHYYKMIS